MRAVKRGSRSGNTRFWCHACKRWFTKSSQPARNHHDQVLNDHLDGISYRKLVARYGLGRTVLCEIVNHETEQLQPHIAITKQFFPACAYSGAHIVDGKYIPVKEVVRMTPHGKIPRSWKRRKVKRGMVLIWGADYGTHDLLHHEFGLSENVFLFGNYFRTLKELGYQMKSCTIDDKKELFDAILAYYPQCIIQLCIRHYLAKISKISGIKHVIVKINSYERRLNRLFPNKDIDRIPPSRQYALARAIRYANAVADLEFQYELLVEFYHAVIAVLCADTHAVALRRIESLERYFLPKAKRLPYPSAHVRIVDELFKDLKTNQEYLLNYLKYPHMHIPSTTNLVEGYNSQLENRLASIRGFESEITARNYVNAWILKRRFTKFECCKKPFKHLNGKTPLECAGADISKVTDWISFCRKRPLGKSAIKSAN